MSNELNIDELKKLVSELSSQLAATKKYGLVWDKDETKEKIVADCEKNIPVLEPEDSRTIKLHGQNHILIEGDNFLALTALKMTFSDTGFADVIYIDPPYNTGNKDFKYNDNYVDAEDGFRHSKWLSFIKPRLQLARSLLKNSGMIMISIDEHEEANLKLLCNAIFGEQNFLANMIWQSTPGSNTGLEIKTVTEYVLVYAKNAALCKVSAKPAEDDSKYTLEDEFVARRGKYTLNKLDRRMTGPHYSEALNYPLTMADGSQLWPGCMQNRQEHWNWRWSESKVKWGIENNFIVIKKSKNKWVVYFKQYFKVDNTDTSINRSTPFQNLIQNEDGINAARGTQDLMSLLGKKSFDYPKPVNLIKLLLKIHPNKNATILDFFAGSGTTGQAVLELNNEDGGNRQFILCTNNENDICTGVTYPRLKTVISGEKPDGSKYSDGIPANMYYFKTSFIEDQKNTDQAKYNLVANADSYLCILENVFDLVERNDYSSHYSSDDGLKHLFIYNDFFNQEKFAEFKKRICSAKGERVVYVFSSENELDESLFLDLPDVVAKPIPSKIYEIYKHISEEIKRGE